ncbi:MAG: OmpH family outer membrane protein [Spirosomataceae bacterium]
MKKTIFALVALAAFLATPSLAQTPTKIGYTDVDVILSRLPDAKKIQNELEVTRAQFEKTIQEKIKEFQEKLDRYQKNAQNMNEVLRADSERELQNLQRSIEDLQTSSQQSLFQKQQSLLTPVLDKISNAIQEIGKEQGYLYIINSDTGQNANPVLLYVGSEEYNVTDLVLTKLGVDPKAAAQTTTPAGNTP